jgi:DtxR family Mn-dependent transcriptional regulator
MPKFLLSKSFAIIMLTRKIEDYLEAILNIIEERGYAKTNYIATTLDVKPPSVTEMMKKLDEMGFVFYRKYGGVILTQKGEEIAKSVKGRHDTFLELLKLLQVPDSIADKDACTMEHDLDPKTIIQLKKFVSFVKNCPKVTPEWIEHFKIYSKTGKFPIECKK